MAHSLYFKDGSVEYIFQKEETPEFYDDFQKIIYEKLGRDAESVIDELRKKADYTTQKVNTDLTAYEGELESNTTAFIDIKDQCNFIENTITFSKRLNREELLKCVNRIKTIIKNQI